MTRAIETSSSSPRQGAGSRPTAWMNRITGGLRILLALAFAAAAAPKLLGAEAMVQLFQAIGFGQWFRLVTGLVELAGAALLLVPGAGFLGGLLLAATMACATLTHLVLVGGSPVPAAILFALSAFVAWRLKPRSRGALAG
ncbi:hypothetical protein BN1110_05688 [bacterium YEK0313]|nr:hypothetical protein BN1110_05688 [bacterium YEK0313]